MAITIRSPAFLPRLTMCVVQEVIDCLDTHGQAMSVHGAKGYWKTDQGGFRPSGDGQHTQAGHRMAQLIGGEDLSPNAATRRAPRIASFTCRGPPNR